jgi:hypothetical protein
MLGGASQGNAIGPESSGASSMSCVVTRGTRDPGGPASATRRPKRVRVARPESLRGSLARR